VGVEMEAICLTCWPVGRNILGFETTPGFRLSREFETSRIHDLYPPQDRREQTTRTDIVFIPCG